jgi:hypothetical protein
MRLKVCGGASARARTRDIRIKSAALLPTELPRKDECGPHTLAPLLPLADLAHALVEVEFLEALTSTRGISMALPCHRAEPVNDGLNNSIAGLQDRHCIAARRPAGADGESHGVFSSRGQGDARWSLDVGNRCEKFE